MDTDDTLTLIERWATQEPFLDHKKDFDKCGTCLKQMLRKQVAEEFVVRGLISNDYLTEYEAEVTKRFQKSYLFKEIKRLTKDGKTLDEAIAIMESRGFYP